MPFSTSVRLYRSIIVVDCSMATNEGVESGNELTLGMVGAEPFKVTARVGKEKGHMELSGSQGCW